MGQILSQPRTEKFSDGGKDKHLAYGLSCMQGWRINMEDAHSSLLNLLGNESNTNEHVSFFGVYDGHGGDKVAQFAGNHLHEFVMKTKAFRNKDYVNALRNGFLNCDQAILKDNNMKNDSSGCAATTVIFTPSEVICANAGDSRTVLSVNGFSKDLSIDHKPTNEGEHSRITFANGCVVMGRVNGNLALSRALGDFEYKGNEDLPAEAQVVTCFPDVILHKLDYERDEFIVLACDGIWDALSSQDCVECVRSGILVYKPLPQICEDIMDLCCAPTSNGPGIGCDNMTIVIVALLDYSKNETLDEWYNKIHKKIQIAASNNSNSSEYAKVSVPFPEKYQELYGSSYEIGQHSQNSRLSPTNSEVRVFTSLSSSSQDGNENKGGVSGEKKNDDTSDSTKRITSLNNILASNAITREDGVVYLDTSSAQAILAQVGYNDVSNQEKIEADDENIGQQ